MQPKYKDMPLYVGTLYANATLMTRAAYNEYRGWKLPANEQGDDMGYLVIDQHGPSNTPDDIGYASWLPKDVFERTHLLVGDVSDLPPSHQLLKAERTQLMDRIQKLVADIGTDHFLSLDAFEQSRLNSQLDYMQSYRRELDERLIALAEAEKEKAPAA
ncbi:hypothetical protein K9O81_18775 [Leclercia adecarboxylata]|uniref:crAss001_48 related protein n=1 Tax=Leclercia adecarboxylata TaxID=83655 RepID=UPI001CBB742E|nr:hypothetical protein [Leclercia adecarboxylata]MBZ3802415.1 hypothetical protein [Leclercia adecarboxylata]MBZ3807051.1 hypothetical protein [Leclercia adecarboxylata]